MLEPVTGELLYQELRDAACASGKSLAAFVAPLFNGNSWKIEQLRIARNPTRPTIERVRALCTGGPLPPTRKGQYVRDQRAFGLSRQEAEAAGIPPSKRSIYEEHLLHQQLNAKQRVERLLEISERARLTRKPGQTIADRARELRAEIDSGSAAAR